MQTKVLGEKMQEFNGERFYQCGFYYQHNGKRLHRTVWEYHNGAIPKGYHVHHIDEDRSNNNIDNLELIPASEHLSRHSSRADRKAKAKEMADKYRPLTKEWHASPEGRAWHSKQSLESWAKRTPRTYICSFCGKEFTTMHHYSEGSNHFCHNNCKAAYRRRRVRDASA